MRRLQGASLLKGVRIAVRDARKRFIWLRSLPIILFPVGEHRRMVREMNSKAVLEVEGLSKEFDVKRKRFFDKQEKLRAVQDVSLTVLEGETLGIVGESGCGKSTLGRLIMRLIEPTAGKICLDGEDLTSMSQKELRLRRKDFQMIFQDPYAAFNPRMTVQKILEEPL